MTEPITLDEAKAHLRVDVGDDDPLIIGLIEAARLHAEHETRRILVRRQLSLTLDAFPGPSLMGVPFGTPISLPGHAITLEWGPIASIDAINYTDMAGNPQIMPAMDYAADISRSPARITPRFGKIWPISLPQIGAVRIDYTAGYATSADVPAGIKQWMLLRVGVLYENREETVVGSRIVVADLPFVDRLLDPYRVMTFV